MVVCNGHYSDARRAELPGAESFPGTIVHSHSYRDNQAFAGLTVIVIGASASGADICREIALTAEKVALAPCLLPSGGHSTLKRERHWQILLERACTCWRRPAVTHVRRHRL